MIAIPLLTNAPGVHASWRGWIILDEQTGERIDFVHDPRPFSGGPGMAPLIDYAHRRGTLVAQLVTATRPIRVSQREFERWAATDPPHAS